MSTRRKLQGSERLQEFLVGLFFILALCILGVFTIIIKQDVWFADVYKRQIDFESIGGVAVGDKVMLRGLEVGRVTKLEPVDSASRIRMTVSLAHDLQFYEGYKVEIRTLSALGGKYVYIELGKPSDPPVPAGQTLNGTPPLDLLDEATKVTADLKKAVNEVMAIVSQVKDEDSTVHRLLYQSDMYDEIKTSFQTLTDAGTKVGDAMEELKNAGSRVDKALADVDSLKKEFSVAAENVSKAGDSLTKAGDSVSEASTSLKEAIADARAGKGTIGKLMTDDQLYNDAKEAVADLRKSVAAINGTNSSLGKIMHDDGELYASIKDGFDNIAKTMEEANELVRKAKEGEGTIGRLMADDSLYRETQDTIREVRGAVSDFREQSPILTFGSFVFGAL